MKDLRQRIRQVFPLHPIPKSKLADSLVFDRDGDESVRFEEHWTNWTEIEDRHLELCEDAPFTLLEPEAAIYYLPRYMIWVLDDIEKKLKNKSPIASPGDFAVYFLLRHRRNDFKESGLNPFQIKVAEEFITEIVKDPEYFETIHVYGQEPYKSLQPSMETMIQNPNKTDVKRILQECHLPVSDITPAHLKDFFASGDGSGLFGVIGLEIYGSVALLRSLAVLPKHRSAGVGKRLVAHAEKHALAQEVRTIYLLTTTADKFFSGLGYSSVSRDQAPPAIQSTAEFSILCPSSSIFMVKRLGG